MLDGLFDDDNSSDEFAHLGNASGGQGKLGKSRMRNIADDLDLPPIPRDPGIFAGLVNQGATCYLNCLFQTFFFCPELREFFYSLDLETMDAYEKGTDKYKVIHEFQLFFAKLKYCDFKNQSTSNLTAAFGWAGGEGSQQQDVGEAMRIIFDTLEKCFFPSGKTEAFTKTFKGQTLNYIKTLTCGTNKERSEYFYDLLLPIKNFSGANCKSIDESLQFLMNPELMDGPNQYSCETCACKVDALKGQKIGQLPDVLTMTLCRFDLNYQTWQRLKINDYYKFDLRMNFRKYTGADEDQNYDLFAVLIHRGDAYGGHYHSIIRDTLEECDGLKDFFLDIEEKDKKEINQEKKERKWIDGAKDLGEERTSFLREEFCLLNDNKVKNEGKKEHAQMEEECEDPFPTDVERTPETEYLFNNWYDFDDTRVKKFDVNKLHKYFGNSRESAYILMYRKTEKHQKKEYYRNLTPPANVYQEVLQMNETMKYSKIYYEKMKFKLTIKLGIIDNVFNLKTMDLKEGFEPEKMLPLTISKYDLVKDIKNQTKELFNLPNDQFFLVLLEKADNETLDLTQVIGGGLGSCGDWVQVQDLKIFHKTHWMIVSYDHPQIDKIIEKLSIKNSQKKIKVKVEEEIFELMVPQFMSNSELIQRLSPFVSWPLTLSDISIIDFGETRPLLELPLITRSSGIPRDGFEFVLRQKIMSGSSDQIIFLDNGGSAEFYEKNDFKSLLISRDQNQPPSKIVVDYKIKLNDLLDILKNRFNIPLETAMRLRNLLDNRLFSQEDLTKNLIDLGYVEGGQRLRFEHGKTPKQGGISVIIKYDFFHEKGKTSLSEDFIMYLNKPLNEYMPKITSRFNVDEAEHNLYMCNWINEPVKKLKHPNLTIEELGFESQQVLKLVHNSRGLSSEMRSYRVYFSESGFPDQKRSIGDIKINETKNIKVLFTKIYDHAKSIEGDFDQEFTSDHLLVREMSKKGFPARVLNGLKKSIKKNKINCISLIFTIFEEKPKVQKTDLRLFIRKRSTSDYIYGDYDEIVINTNEETQNTLDGIKNFIKKHKKIEEEKEIALIRYNTSKYKWLRMSEETTTLTRKPYYLKNGDVLGYLVFKKGEEPKDDFQTEEDKAYLAALEIKEDSDVAMLYRKKNDNHGFEMKISMD